METLTRSQVREAGLDEWRQLGNLLCTRYPTPDFATGLALLERIGAAAEAAGHHPDVALGWGYLEVRLTSHDAGGITCRDLDLARTVSTIAAQSGVSADPTDLTIVELALDAALPDRVRPFWAAMLGARDTGEQLEDPRGWAPSVWFQVPEGPAPSGEVPQRWHLDIWVPQDRAGARIDAALAAGGTMVDESWAPAFWVLADSDGNRTCVCTGEQPAS